MKRRRLTRAALIAIAAVVLTAVSGPPVRAQNLMVRPMRIEFSSRPNRIANLELILQNRSTAASGPLEFRVVELTQSRQGNWQIVYSEYRDEGDRAPARFSAREWVELPEETVEVDPLSTKETPIRIRIPADARGTYFAGLLVSTERPEIPAGAPDRSGAFGVRFRLLVPIIVEIEGRPVQQRVSFEHLSMTRDDSEDARAGATRATVQVVNDGATFSRIRGSLRIDRKQAQRWRTVTTAEFRERGILPGATIELSENLERRLPSGTYRLRGELWVDGRRTRPIEKEIEFEGDPDADMLAFDTTLQLDPAAVLVDVAPGSTRTTVLTVENPAEEPLTVRLEASTPDTLQGVALGALHGDELSAARWTEIRPGEFTIGPGARQNVRVLMQTPRDAVEHANYYADLILRGSYSDGQSAGETRSSIQLRNRTVESEPRGQLDRLRLAEGSQHSHYAVQSRFTNIGNIHLEPSARVELLGTGTQAALSRELDTEPGRLLPLGRRDFGGELDFSGIDEGEYLLRATVRYGDNHSSTAQLPVTVQEYQVRDDDGEPATARRVKVIEDEDGQQELIEEIEAP